MTTVRYPYFDLDLDISIAYLNNILKPYGEALFAVNPLDGENAVEALKQWSITLLPGEHGTELVLAIDALITRLEEFPPTPDFLGNRDKFFDILIARIKT